MSVATRARESANYRWWALGAVLTGFFSTTVTITLLTAVLPTIARELGVGQSTIAWVVIGPMLATGVLMPALGKAGDLYGHKRVYVTGWVVYTACALGAALSWNAAALIGFRLAGAAAGAATGPSSQAIILRAFDPKERVTALGWHSFVSAGAPVLGLVIGGPLVDLVGWRWVFGVQVPLAVPGLVLMWLVVRPDAPSRPAPFDFRGAATFGLAVASLLYGLNRAGAGSPGVQVVVPMVVAVVLGLVFVSVERRHPSPVMPLHYFRRRNVSFGVAALLLGSAPYMGVFFLGPFFMHEVLGYDNTRTASALMFRPLAFSLSAAVAGYLAVRLGERSLAVAGAVVMAGGMGVMAGLGPTSTFTHLALGMALAGLGHGLSGPPLTSSVANAVEPEDFGAISAAQNMVRTVGTTSGMQMLQTYLALRTPSAGAAAAYREAFGLATVVAALAVVVTAGIRSMPRRVVAPEASLVAEPSGLGT